MSKLEPKAYAGDELKTRELIAEESALMTLRGIGINEQAKQLSGMYSTNVTRTTLLKLKNHPKFIEVTKAQCADMAANGKMVSLAMLGDAAPEFVKCLIEESKNKNVKAAIAGLQLLVGKDVKDGPEQKQAIQIVLATEAKPERPV